MENTQMNLKDFGLVFDIIRKRIFLVGVIFTFFIAITIYKSLFDNEDVFKVKFTIDSILIKDIINNIKDAKSNDENTYSRWIIENIINNFVDVVKEKLKHSSMTENQYKRYTALKKIEIEAINLSQSSFEYYRPVNITLYIHDTAGVSVTIDELIASVNTNPYIKRCNDLERQKNNQKKEYYQASLKEAEPLLKNQVSMQFNMFLYVLELRNKIIEIDSKLSHYNGIEIVIDPIIIFEPSSKNILRNFILFGILGLFTGIVVAVFIEKIFAASFK